MAPFPSPTSTWHNNTYQSISPTSPELSAKGKTVVVTGAGSGIGAETARRFAEAGASRIALLGRREQSLLNTKASIKHKFNNVEVFVASTDVSKKSEVDPAFAKFAGDGQIHVLVSNAAIRGPEGLVGKVDSDEFLETIQQNVGVPYLLSRHSFATRPRMHDVSSSAAHLNFSPGFSAYSVGKLAVVRLWDSVAFGNLELRVFYVQPGVVTTETNKTAWETEDDGVSLPACFHVCLASPEARFLKNKFLWSNWMWMNSRPKPKILKLVSDLVLGLLDGRLRLYCLIH